MGLANHTILLAKEGVEWPIDDSAAPITSTDGQITGAVLVFREIGERKRHEEAMRQHADELESANQRMSELLEELRDSEQNFHAMVDQLPQLAWMTKADGFIYWYNQRWYEYTGKRPEELAGWGWQSVHDPNELPRVLACWTSALASGQAWEDTFPLRRHDGVMRWHLSRAVPWRNERGEIQGWFGTNTDITDRLQMEAALKEADLRKDEFLATLAHELRNRIAPISNALQLWPMVEGNHEEMERLRGIMERQVRQMTRLIDDLLDVSRITRGKIQLRRQPVDLATIVQGAIEAVSPLIESCRHRLEVELPETPLHVDGDVARLTQVVGNVLQNAAKYTGNDGLIQVSVARRDDQAVVAIRDNGPGIPPTMLQRIFEMFQQVDQTLDRSHGGLGLGLTLVKRLVDLHGGNVQANSQGEGTGSEFTISLPLLDVVAPARPAARDGKKLVPGELPAHCVLVVDDVRASAKTLGMMLESLGQQVTLAHDGATAIDTAREVPPDVIFMDIAMPGMDGYEAARRMRDEPALEGVTLVALTGYGHDEDRRRAMDAGFDQHLIKPVSMDQLGQLLASVKKSGPSQSQASPPAVD